MVESEEEILNDASIQLVLSSTIPNERAPLGVRVMKHGKDYLSDKPGATTLAQIAEIRKTIAETKRIYAILYSERLEVKAAVKAGELVQAGAIGRVIQTINIAPHQIVQRVRILTRVAVVGGRIGSGSRRSMAGFCATSGRTRWISFCFIRGRRRRRWWLRRWRM